MLILGSLSIPKKLFSIDVHKKKKIGKNNLLLFSDFLKSIILVFNVI